MSEATVAALLRAAAARLGGAEGRLEAELLLAAAAGRPRSWCYAHATDVPAPAVLERFEHWLRRREAGEPVAHLVGRREFWSLDLAVSADTLVPRPETERLVELALACLPAGRAAAVLDLGTGSGAIALALARERPGARVVAVDASAAALAVARANGQALAPGRIDWRQGHWFAPVHGERFDLVASNPPYLAADDPHLHAGGLWHEPREALVSGADGLEALREIIAGAPAHLRPGGWLLVEHGRDQGAAARALFESAGFRGVRTEPDLEGRDRVTLGQARPGGAG